MGPGALSEILKDLPNLRSDKLLVGFDTADDACVYKVSSETAVIQTVDFFTPVADDPYIFGQIAAANSLSDVYAMGGSPALAMNLLCVPNCLSPETIRDILRGGHDKAVEAGCVIAGGHTIEDKEPKYGMCVTGFVHPDRILRNTGAKPGDVLILTKPIGSGIIITAQKGELISQSDYDSAIGYMSRLNKYAGEVIAQSGVIHACTDITGFGLLGHVFEMASGSEITVELSSVSVPLMSGAADMAELGILPAGAYRNRNYVSGETEILASANEVAVDVMCDPQTSGGLLVAVPEEDADGLLQKLKAVEPMSAEIGRVLPKGEKTIIIK